jgi:hypothetical protein
MLQFPGLRRKEVKEWDGSERDQQRYQMRVSLMSLTGRGSISVRIGAVPRMMRGIPKALLVQGLSSFPLIV